MVGLGIWLFVMFVVFVFYVLLVAFVLLVAWLVGWLGFSTVEDNKSRRERDPRQGGRLFVGLV